MRPSSREKTLYHTALSVGLLVQYVSLKQSPIIPRHSPSSEVPAHHQTIRFYGPKPQHDLVIALFNISSGVDPHS